MKICAECKHFINRGELLCAKTPKVPDKVDIVTGLVEEGPPHWNCRMVRTASYMCGKEGRYWEPRDPGQLYWDHR